MTTHQVGICSGVHAGQTITVELADGEQHFPREQYIDGYRYVLEWGTPESGIGLGRHYCPRPVISS
jgi:hypothetical protein